MPKIILNLREIILRESKRILKTESYDKLTVRRVAKACGVAVGTVYNYFPSKEALIAEAMMCDWLECSRGMKEDAAREHRPLEAIRATAAALRRFTSRYAPLWRNYAEEMKSLVSLELRHRQIIAEIAGAVRETLIRFDLLYDPNLPDVIAELVLMAGRTEDGFERIAPALERILR